MGIFKYDNKTKDTIKMANKSRTHINGARDILKKIEIPADFKNSNKIKKSIDMLNDDNLLVKKSNSSLTSSINKILAAQNSYKRIKVRGNNKLVV